MRKLYKNMIFELLETLRYAASEAKNLLAQNDKQTLINLLADCQDCANQIGEIVEQFENAEHVTVSYLSEYCELLYRISLEADKHDGNIDIKKELRKQLSRISNSVENDIKTTIEVVFLPYKSSMFDSLESIWLAAKDDPYCDAYVVPIPYYDKNPDGSFGKMYYEGGEYPDYVPVMDWRSYNLEERRPDVIFIHNPYDDGNYVSSIHPDYYSKRLREFTDRLCYVPYFVITDLTFNERFAVNSGCVYAHKIFVQTNKTKQMYINGYKKTFGNKCGNAENKFLAFGSPKFDKIINTRRENCLLPEKWLRLIEKSDGTSKKVVFYNTSLSTMLQNNEQYLEKLRYVLDVFKKREDVVLWWRPHPLMEQTFNSIRPWIAEEYRSIVREYKRDEFGIYDDTTDLHRAIAWSDAYFGDYSSVMFLYNSTGKPLLVQWITANNSNYNKKITFSDFKIIDNTVWLVSNFIKGLFSFDLDKKDMKFINVMSNENALYTNSYIALSVSGINIILLPCIGDYITQYNIKDNSSKTLKLKHLNAVKFNESCLYKDSVYAIPARYPAIVKYDPKTGLISENEKLCRELDKLKTSDTDFYFYKGFAVNGNYLMLASGVGNAVVKYNMDSDKFSIIRVGSLTYKYTSIAFDGENYWLLTFKNGIVKWNEKKGIIKEINLFPSDFIHGETQDFYCAVVFENSVFVFPNQSNMILKIDIKTNHMESFTDIDGREKDSIFFSSHLPKYKWAEKYGDYIYAFSLYENCLQKINPRTRDIENIPLVLADGDYKEIINQPLFNPPPECTSEPITVTENSVLSLPLFLDKLTTETINPKQISYEYFKSCAGNTDGTCGKEIYEYIKSEILK